MQSGLLEHIVHRTVRIHVSTLKKSKRGFFFGRDTLSLLKKSIIERSNEVIFGTFSINCPSDILKHLSCQRGNCILLQDKNEAAQSCHLLFIKLIVSGYRREKTSGSPGMSTSSCSLRSFTADLVKRKDFIYISPAKHLFNLSCAVFLFDAPSTCPDDRLFRGNSVPGGEEAHGSWQVENVPHDVAGGAWNMFTHGCCERSHRRDWETIMRWTFFLLKYIFFTVRSFNSICWWITAKRTLQLSEEFKGKVYLKEEYCSFCPVRC